MFGFPKKSTAEEKDQQKLIDKLKGVPYSPNAFRIEVRVENGKEVFVAQKRWEFGNDWLDIHVSTTEEDARSRIQKSREYDYELYLKEEAKKVAVVVRHIDV